MNDDRLSIRVTPEIPARLYAGYLEEEKHETEMSGDYPNIRLALRVGKFYSFESFQREVVELLTEHDEWTKSIPADCFCGQPRRPGMAHRAHECLTIGAQAEPEGGEATLSFTDECILALERAVNLLDAFDRYASVPADNDYCGSPFQADVQAFLAGPRGATQGGAL